jgi:citrate lyase subunit beta / citryl-CoA lyase
MATTPRQALFDAAEPAPPALPVCDHYAGAEARMKKSLALQAELGPVFDVTLDNEDGATLGGEIDQAHLIAALLGSADNCFGRVGVRLLPLDHSRFADVLAIVLRAPKAPAYLMLPKPRGLADVQQASAELHRAGGAGIALHALIETHGALREVFDIALHPHIESLSFGLMDFVSAHRGAIPQSAMGATGQFDHPLVVRAKLEIAAACHAANKTPSHCVVTEFKDKQALQAAAEIAQQLLGYTRMWSIHPEQIRIIVDAFAPTVAEVDQAIAILQAAQAADWAPTRYRDTLHDRASYRYFWQVLERAQRGSVATAKLSISSQRWCLLRVFLHTVALINARTLPGHKQSCFTYSEDKLMQVLNKSILAAALLSLALPLLAKTPAASAKAPAKDVPLSQGQMDAAGRVFTGTANCEFGQTVSVSAIAGKPGHFKLSHNKANYTLVPEVTTTGAVRLEDRKAGIVWLQIPAKSMLMNAKLGRRLVDACQTPQQKV